MRKEVTVMKKLIAILLVAAALLSLSVTALAATPAFPDVTDPDTAENVAALRMLGVIEGSSDGRFYPASSLTRAQFCKMAVVIMGRGGEEASYRSRTIFPDVRATHWARGYINLAVSGDSRIIQGNADGTFKPDSAITFAQATTILMRVLGYTDADVGMLWPVGYMNLAADIGLTAGITGVGNGGAITRAQAARLFRNLLSVKTKEGAPYMNSLGTVTASAIVLSLDAKAEDGTTGAMKTSAGTYKVKSGVLPAEFLGLRGSIVTDGKGQALTFIPDSGKRATVTAAAANAGWLRDSSGKQHTISPETPAYTSEKSGKYGELFIDIQPGADVTLYYTADGAPSGVFINTARVTDAVVAGEAVSAASFSKITGGDTGYTVFKNGYAATLSDIRQYDVATYNPVTRTLTVTDFRLTGSYEDVWPNPQYPSRITVMGQSFDVLPMAASALSAYKLGEVFTLLLTGDNQVAGVVSSGTVTNTAVGIVDDGSTSERLSVTLFNGIQLSGSVELASGNVERLVGELVTVLSRGAGKLTVSQVTGGPASGALNVSDMTLGAASLSPGVRIYERVGKSRMTQISLSDIPISLVPAEKILFTQLDGSGRVSLIVLGDVTGDLYEYGFLKGSERSGSLGGLTYTNKAVSVINKDNPEGTTPVIYVTAFKENSPGGVAVSGDGESAAGVVLLTEAKGVSRSAFKTVGGKMYVTVNGEDIRVADNVQCYNRDTSRWFATLSDARAYSDTLTVYYDRSPAQGGKIRLLVAE